jgi:hypothetical protein
LLLTIGFLDEINGAGLDRFIATGMSPWPLMNTIGMRAPIAFNSSCRQDRSYAPYERQARGNPNTIGIVAVSAFAASAGGRLMDVAITATDGGQAIVWPSSR